jgi:hypothetical protein
VGIEQERTETNETGNLTAPAVPREALDLLPGCLHLAFHDGKGVSVHQASGEFVIYTCVESGRGLAGNYFRPDRLLDRRLDHVKDAGADWLVPWLRQVKDGEAVTIADVIELYRSLYRSDPVES